MPRIALVCNVPGANIGAGEKSFGGVGPESAVLSGFWLRFFGEQFMN